eukprot:TRINITY_DN3619_c0_g1_i2.p2 TRINITY_DN3619_c0_g1~~TRINITY_DN3619_c0_g1_i2.p2  ORF type:complete len:172 (-),score=9.54 TRINITY_DN3619_c0_g1_i2:178-693(-)
MATQHRQSWGGSELIENQLYIGGYYDVTELFSLDINTHKIKAVLTVAKVPYIYTLAEPFTVPEGIKHKKIEVLDTEQTNILNHLEECCQFISENVQTGGVVVHCMCGISRSSTVCIAYIMKTRGWGRDQAYQYVKNKHRMACPNDGFWKQLEQFEAELLLNQSSAGENSTG